MESPQVFRLVDSTFGVRLFIINLSQFQIPISMEMIEKFSEDDRTFLQKLEEGDIIDQSFYFDGNLFHPLTTTEGGWKCLPSATWKHYEKSIAKLQPKTKLENSVYLVKNTWDFVSYIMLPFLSDHFQIQVDEVYTITPNAMSIKNHRNDGASAVINGYRYDKLLVFIDTNVNYNYKNIYHGILRWNKDDYSTDWNYCRRIASELPSSLFIEHENKIHFTILTYLPLN